MHSKAAQEWAAMLPVLPVLCHVESLVLRSFHLSLCISAPRALPKAACPRLHCCPACWHRAAARTCCSSAQLGTWQRCALPVPFPNQPTRLQVQCHEEDRQLAQGTPQLLRQLCGPDCQPSTPAQALLQGCKRAGLAAGGLHGRPVLCTGEQACSRGVSVYQLTLPPAPVPLLRYLSTSCRCATWRLRLTTSSSPPEMVLSSRCVAAAQDTH